MAQKNERQELEELRRLEELEKKSSNEGVAAREVVSQLKSLYGGLQNPARAFLEDVLPAISYGYESAITSPTRAGVSAAIKEPDYLQKIPAALSATGSQFLQDPSLAPSGEDILKQVGVTNPTALKYGGIATEIGLDPTLFISPGKLAMGGLRAVGKGAAGVARAGALTTDVLTGAKLGERGLEIGKGIVGSTKKAVEKFTKPQLSQSAEKFKKLALEAGIDPTDLPASLEFGPSSELTFMERKLAEGPTGEKFREKYINTADKISSKIDDIKAIETGGMEYDDVMAGQLIKQEYPKAIDNFFKPLETTYDNIVKNNPGVSLSKNAVDGLISNLNEIDKFGDKVIKSAFTNEAKAEGALIKSAVEKVRTTGATLEDIRELMFGLKKAYERPFLTGATPVDVASFKKIYNGLSNAFIQTTKDLIDKDLASELVDNNKQITDFLKEKGVIAKTIETFSNSPEKISKSLRGNTANIKAFREIFKDSPEVMNALKSAELNASMAPESFGRLGKSIEKNAFKLRAHGMAEDVINRLKDYSEMGDNIGNYLLSTSGTGASATRGDLIRGIAIGEVTEGTLKELKARARRAYLDEALKKELKTEGIISSPTKRARITKIQKGVQTLQSLTKEKKEE